MHTSEKHSHRTPGSATLWKRGQEDHKSQRIREFVVRIHFFGNIKVTPTKYHQHDSTRITPTSVLEWTGKSPRGLHPHKEL